MFYRTAVLLMIISVNICAQHMPSGNKCYFSTRAEIYSNIKSLTPEKQSLLKALNSRPILHTSIVSSSGYFRVHYDTTGSEKPGYDASISITENVKKICDIIDSAYSFEISYLGYPLPPTDDDSGGDNCYDVYIIDFPNGYYGDAPNENQIASGKWTSFIKIDNDFAGSSYFTHGFDAARVTLAHEFHHAIQMGCYRLDFNESFFHELTSTSMEEFVYGDVNDYYGRLRDYFNYPGETFSRYSGYELPIWNLMLKENYGFGIIKRQWELFADNPALMAINLSLLEEHSSFKNELNEFGIWTFYTGHRAQSDKYFKEAKNYPVIRPEATVDFSSGIFPIQLSTSPLSNNFIRIKIKNKSWTDTVTIKITDGDLSRALNAPSSLLKVDFSMYPDSAAGSRRVVNNYFSKLVCSKDVLSEVDFFNDKIVNGATVIFSESDYAYPNPFNYHNRLNNDQVNIPVSYDETKATELNIYSAALKLVYSGQKSIIADPQTDKFVVTWDGKDLHGNKLQTGVYIYVTYSGGNMKKGKIVIKNEE